MSCLYLPPRSHSSKAANRFFCSLQSHTGCKIHLRCESQRNVWAIITLHICGSFFQSSWEFQQSWAISNKIVFFPQTTPGRCHKVARSGLSSQLSYSADQKSTKTWYIFKKQKDYYEPKQNTLKTVTLKLQTHSCPLDTTEVQALWICRQNPNFCIAELPGPFCLGTKSR